MNAELPLGGRSGVGGLRRPKTSRKVTLVVVAAILSVAAGFLGYSRFAAPSQPIAPPQTAIARLGSLVSTVSATGSVVATRQAKLSFLAAGKLVELNVAVGNSVKGGQLLARQDPAPLQSKLTSAESALTVAQMNLQTLKQGATPDELEAAQLAYDLANAKYQETVAGPTEADKQAAQAAVEQAKSGLSSAQAKLDDLKAGPTQADVASAQSAVTSAKASLASAQAKLDDVKTSPTATDLASAEAAVEAARSKLSSAQVTVDQMAAGNGKTTQDIQTQILAVNKAYSDLVSVQDNYDKWVNGNVEDSGYTSNTDALLALQNAQLTYNIQAAKLDSMKATAASDAATAQSDLQSAKADYGAAVDKLDKLKKGPTAVDLSSAESGIETAKSSLVSAQSKLDTLLAGPTATDLASAQSAVDQANANLITAQSKLDTLLAGPKDSDILSAKSALVNAKVQLASKTTIKEADLIQQEEQVRQAEAAVEQAQLDLASGTMTAPFDGIVSAVSGNMGENVSENAAVVTLVDPNAFRVDVTVDETDVAKLRAGQAATITFDALPDERIQGRVIGVAPAGSATQGVVSYLVSVGVDNPTRQFPFGMSAVVSVETERKDNALLVPNRAVRTVSRNKVVDVVVDPSTMKTESRTVQIGSANDQMTEIVSGVQEGESVVIPSTTIRSSMSSGSVGGPVMKVGGGR